MSYKYKAVIEEAIRELNIPDDPDLYHRMRRWVRKNIKRQPLEPIDLMNWPKGCLMVGLMAQARQLIGGDTSEERALGLVAMSEVKSHIDRWIRRGAPVYKIDDCLAGQALLELIEIIELDVETGAETGPSVNDCTVIQNTSDDFRRGANQVGNRNVELLKYKQSASKIMQFLYGHDKDLEGALPYRPNQKNGRIFADGIGMVVPFAIKYGIMFDDEDAIQLALDQVNGFMKHGIDVETGLPWHSYSISGFDHDDNTVTIESGDLATTKENHFGDLGWGRGTGWIMYGLGVAAGLFLASVNSKHLGTDVFTTPIMISAGNTLGLCLEKLSESVQKYKKADKLYGSQLTNFDSEVDTSATVMILFGLRERLRVEEYRHNGSVEKTSTDSIPKILSNYITSEGYVIQAQGECIDFGQYGPFGSYPWSVGMMLKYLAE